MNTRVLTIIIAAVVSLVVGIGIGAIIWAGGGHGADSASSSMSHSMGDDMMTSSGAMEERAFLEEMVPHHESAVAMATMALEKSSRPQVRQLAQAIVDAQEGEIDQMRQWYQQWYGTELPDSDTSGMDMGDLEAASGADFDRMFLREMIAHHASAIMMAQEVSAGSPRKEVATLSDAIIAAQSKEIGQMQSWRAQWYPPLG